MAIEQALTPPISAPEAFVHVRIIIGIVLGLCISRVLIGSASLVQHPHRKKTCFTHMAWVAYALLSVVHFWWLEFNLRVIQVWNFETYLFIIFFAALHFLLCAMLFPEHMQEYASYHDYFISRRRWFFGLLITIQLADVYDTVLKGWDHFYNYGAEYPLAVAIIVGLSIFAMVTRKAWFHAGFAALALLYAITFSLRHFSTLG